MCCCNSALKIHFFNRKYLLMIFNKNVFHRSLLEKMPIAFFNISRSNSTSFSFFSNRWIFSCSGDNFRCPFPGKLPAPNSSCSLRYLYNRVNLIPSSLANSEMFDRSWLNVTALRLKTDTLIILLLLRNIKQEKGFEVTTNIITQI